MDQKKRMRVWRIWVFENMMKKIVFLNLKMLVGLHLCFFLIYTLVLRGGRGGGEKT